MKKITFLLFLFSVFFSCKEEKTNFTIEGKIDSSQFEELSVYLLVMNQETSSYEKIDSTTVKDSVFFFKGYRDTSALAAVLFPAVSSIPVVIEPGSISVSISSDFNPTISGTSLNDSLQSFFSQLNQLHVEKSFILDSLNTAAKNDSLFEQIYDIENDLDSLMFHFIKNNMNNVLGEAFAFAYADEFELEKQEELLDMASNRFRALSKMQQLMDRTENRKKMLNTHFKDFKAKNAENKETNFSEYVRKDKLVLLNFWASWCVPCIEDEMPYLRRLHEKFGKNDLAIVSVSLDNDSTKWRETIDKYDMKWTQLIDSAFTVSKVYQVDVNTIPRSFLINKYGQIVGIDLSNRMLDKKIRELIDGK